MRSMASTRLMPVSLNSGSLITLDFAFLSVFGVEPNKTDISKSIGVLQKWLSFSFRCLLSVASPSIANGALSLLQTALNNSTFSALTARIYRSCDSLHHISIGDISFSSLGIFLSSSRAPLSESLTSSGMPLERPPAPISWIETIGLLSPKFTHVLITSWARLCISGLER